MGNHIYNKVSEELVEKFKKIVPGKVYTKDEINKDFFHDEMPIYGEGEPEVVIDVTTTEAISEIMKLCYENNIPVTPRGAGTGLTGASVAVTGGVMLNMTKMNKILGYDYENFVVKVEPGVLLNDLAEDALKQGLLYPPDPGEKFATLGGHVYGSNVYTGGIGTMLTHFLVSEERAAEIQNICLQCGRCNEVCGGGLHISDMIMKLREKNMKDNPDALKKFALDAVSDRKLFHSMLRIASVAQGMFTKGEPMIRHLPMFLSGMTKGRSFPAIAQVPLRDFFHTIKQDVKNPKGTVAIFAGCLLDFVYTDLARAVVANMNSIGYKVEMPLGQACCGCPATNMGDTENARKEAEININGMESEKYDYVVSACPSCTHQLHLYPTFFEEGTEMHKRAKELAEKTSDFCKLFYELGGMAETGDGKPMKVTYHDSCHLKRSLRVSKEQRELLKNTKSVDRGLHKNTSKNQ